MEFLPRSVTCRTEPTSSGQTPPPRTRRTRWTMREGAEVVDSRVFFLSSVCVLVCARTGGSIEPTSGARGALGFSRLKEVPMTTRRSRRRNWTAAMRGTCVCTRRSTAAIAQPLAPSHWQYIAQAARRRIRPRLWQLPARPDAAAQEPSSSVARTLQTSRARRGRRGNFNRRRMGAARAVGGCAHPLWRLGGRCGGECLPSRARAYLRR